MGRDGEGADGKSALELRDAWQFLVDFLQVVLFRCRLRFFATCFATHNFSRILYVIKLTSTNLLLFANGVQFNSSSEYKVLHTEYLTIW